MNIAEIIILILLAVVIVAVIVLLVIVLKRKPQGEQPAELDLKELGALENQIQNLFHPG